MAIENLVGIRIVGWGGRKKIKLDLLKAYAGEGKTAEEICKLLNLSKPTVMNYGRFIGVKLIPSKTGKERRAERARATLNLIVRGLEEDKGIEEIAHDLGYSPSALHKIVNSDGTSVKEIKKKVLEEKIKTGLEMEKGYDEIADELGCSTNRVRQVANQFGYNHRAMKERKLNFVQDISSIIRNAALQKAYGASWAFGKALEYAMTYSKGGNRRYPIDKKFPMLFSLFSRYQNAFQKGEKRSLEELADEAGFSFTYVGIILKRSGLEPLYGGRERHLIPEEKIEAIKRSLDLEVSDPDIAYFIGVPSYVIANYLVKHGKNKGGKNHPVKSFSNPTVHLTHKRASQVYEAQDLSFGQKEIEEVLGLDSRAVSYALEHRKEVELRIIKALQTIYPARKISRPYLENE